MSLMDLTELELESRLPPCLPPRGLCLEAPWQSGHTLAVGCGGVLLLVLEEKKIKFRPVLKR